MSHGFIHLKQTKYGTARALPFNETLWSLLSGAPNEARRIVGLSRCSGASVGMTS